MQPRQRRRDEARRRYRAAGVNRLLVRRAVARAARARARSAAPTIPRTSSAPIDGARAAGLRHASTSTSSTARRASRSTTGAARSTGALALGVDHVSAYALTVEPGTPLGRDVAAGAAPAPDDDDQAEKYLLADDVLTDAGLRVVRDLELGPPGRGVPAQRRATGPRASTSRSGARRTATPTARRWWNVRTPERYIERIAAQRRHRGRVAKCSIPRPRRDEAFALALRTRTVARSRAGRERRPSPSSLARRAARARRRTGRADRPGPAARQRRHRPGARRIGDATPPHSVAAGTRYH